MKGKIKQRVIASVMALLMTIGLLPMEFLGGNVVAWAAVTTYELDGTDMEVNNGDGIKTTEPQLIKDIFYLDSSKGVTKVDDNKKEFDGVEYTRRIKLYKHSSNPGKIKFEVTGAATVTVCAMSGGTGYNIPYGVYDETGNVVGQLATAYDAASSNPTGALTSDKFTIEKAGTYYIYSTSNDKGLNVYHVTVEVEDSGNTDTITAPVVSTLDVTQNGAVVTIGGTGTAGSADSKYVIVRIDAAGKEKEVGTVDGALTSFTFEDTLTASGEYTYKVYGKGTTNSAEVTAATKAIYVLPLGKAEVTAVADNAKVSLTWKAVSEATSYDVKVYEGEKELADKGVTGLTATSATIEGLTNGTEYGFVVVTNRNTTATDKQTVSDKVTAKPVAPEAGVTWLNANQLDVWSSADDNYVVNDMWTLVPGGSTLAVESCDPVTTTDGLTFTKRISTKGTGSAGETVKRAIKLTLTTDSYVVIYAKSSGSSRPLVLAGEDGKAIETLNLADKDATVAPSRAISLKAGTYYFYSTSGTGYVYGIKVGEGEAPRAAWSTVPNPVIESVTRNSDGTITVKFSAKFGTDGADDGYVFMSQNGFEVASQAVSDSDGGQVTFTPTTEGTFDFKVIIKRAGEADKESEVVSLEGYTLPLVKPTITWVNNLGNGSVYVDWNNIDADSFEVALKSEADADFAVVESGLTKGSYTFTGLTAGMKYDVKITATKEGLTSSDTASFTVGDAEQQWYVSLIGSATSGTITVDGTEYSMKSGDPIPVANVANTDKKVILKCNEDGKVADSEDGILYYYTKINPNTENFKLTATFTVTDTSLNPDNQTAYGIYAADIAGFGSKDAKYFNSVSVGQFKMYGNGYHAHGARLITGYSSYDASNNAGATRNHDNTNVFSVKNELDTVNLGDTFTYTLEKTNEGYVASMAGAGDTILFDGATSIMEQEDGSICIGVAAARKITVEVSNITFEKSEGVAGESSAILTTPKLNIYSSNTAATTDYEFIASPNVGGWLDLYDATGTKVFAGYVEADKVVKIPVTLTNMGGYNGLRYAFAPDKNIPNLTSYSEISGDVTVTLQKWGAEGETIYVSPNGKGGASGTETDPLDLQTALNHAQPGQVIVMLDGTYYPEKDYVIPRSVNGTADKPITLMAQNVGSVVIDGSKMEASSSLISIVGSYWHMYGIEFTNGLGKGVSVCGNYNTVELCTIHNVGNSGLQISRYAGEPNDASMWPSYNLIKNCEAYDCCDPGRNDADGFCAKLTCGEGNKFYGCISHHNIDDGWDLYAKSTTGPIGAVTIENCVAYSNGFLTTDDPSKMTAKEFGEGNGFKLGGENMFGAHKLINSISYNNAGKGITSNSGPDCQVINCTAYNNSLKGGSYNVSLYTKSSNPKAWVLEGMLSVVDNTTTSKELGASNGVMYSLRSSTNYLYDGTQSTNNQGVVATTAWFVSTDITIKPTRNADGTINMHGLLELTADAPSDTGARLNTSGTAASTKPGTTTTVSGKTTVQIIGFTPVALGTTNGVNTGDATPVMPLLIIVMVSAGICGAYIFRRKEQN